MANDDLFNVDFNQLSGGNDMIDLSEAMVEPAEVPAGEPVTLIDDVPITDTESNVEEPAEEPAEVINTQEETVDKGPDLGEESSPVTPFASLLQEKGFLPNLDIDELKSAEDPYEALVEAWGKEKLLVQEQIINSFPEELIDMAKAVAQGVPLDALKNSKIQELNYGKITETQLQENTELQKKLVGESLYSKGFKPEKIKGLIETYEDSGKLQEESKDALGELQVLFKQQQEYTKQQYAVQQKQFEQDHSERIKYIGNTINNTEEVIPGMNLTQKAKNDLFANMTQVVGKDSQGQPIPYVMALREKDPLKFDIAVTYLAQTTKGFTDWGKLNKVAKSSASKELAKTLRASPTRNAGSAKQMPSINGAEEDLMSSITSMFT
tara:strand:- start:13530 stop:14669 length:1140 start_codon:yes stop_codon:yes gene_type:complete